MTYEADNSSGERPTWFAEDSPVRTSATPVRAPAYPASAQDSGGNWCVPFAWFDRSTQSWRTWQLCLNGEWERFAGIWPRAGLMRNGIAYRRAPWAHHTC